MFERAFKAYLWVPLWCTFGIARNYRDPDNVLLVFLSLAFAWNLAVGTLLGLLFVWVF